MTGATTGALLLDLDGTLSDNFIGISRSIRHALARLGATEPDDTELRQCVGPPLRESFARLLATQDLTRIEQAIGFYRERFADIGWRENTLYDGVPAMLAAAATMAGRMYVCTSKPEVFARRIVALFTFTDLFAGIYGADLAGRYDDKAKLLAHLIASENLIPSDTVMVGDRWHDVRAARQNGVRAIGVLWGYGSREELAGADMLIARPEELTTALAATPLVRVTPGCS